MKKNIWIRLLSVVLCLGVVLSPISGVFEEDAVNMFVINMADSYDEGEEIEVSRTVKGGIYDTCSVCGYHSAEITFNAKDSYADQYIKIVRTR